MDCKSRDFDDLNKAIDFLNSRNRIISGINWAGGYIEDESGKWVYEIADDGTVYRNGKEVNSNGDED